MTLLTRVRRLFVADMHEMLDCIEDPEAVLKQAIREMEREIGRDEERINDLKIQEARIAVTLREGREDLGEIEKQLDVVAPMQNDTLMRSLVRRKVLLTRGAKAAERDLARCSDEMRGLVTRLEERKAKVKEIGERVRVFALARKDARPDLPPYHSASEESAAPTDEEIELALLHEKERRLGA